MNRTGPVAAIDVGGTTIKSALVTANGTLDGRVSVPTPPTPHEALDAVRRVAARLAPEAVAVGVVTPGVVRDGIVRYAANLGWRDVPLRAVLADDLRLPVGVDHDVRAAGLAQAAADGADDLLLVALGTGIAGAWVAGGTVRAGATGAAGELGHIPVRPDGPPCQCGQQGCLEVFASAAGIARRYAAAAGEHRDAAQVAARLDLDPAAARVWAEATDALGLALATATLLLDPARIVLAGGLASCGETLAAPVRAALGARLAWRAAPPLTVSTLGADAGLYGAALVARDAADCLVAQ